MTKIINSNLYTILLFTLIIVFGSLSMYAQDETTNSDDENPALAEAQNFVAEGNEELDTDFALAESSYRRAIAKDPSNLSAKYNMGNNYYKNNRYAEGMARFSQAIEVAETKAEKHQAYHNLGNALYKQKNFKQAVEAYKNALRNDPTDDETRYNLALAKEEDEKNGDGDDEDNQDQNEDENQDEDKENEDDQGEDEEGDDGEPKDEGDDGENEKEQGEDEKDEEGKPEDKQGDQENEGDKEEQPQQPQQGKGQLSPQQVQSLLEAMKNEENKVQEKVNAEKVKGTPVQTDKDW